MEYILLAVGTVLVIYFFLITETADRSRKKKVSGQGGEDGAPGAVPAETVPRKPRIRSCPICGAEMGPHDKLYAEVYKAKPRDKVFIKGCPKCHAIPGKPESRPDFLKEVEL